MSKKNQHVVPHENGWAVKGAGNERLGLPTYFVVRARADAFGLWQDFTGEMNA